jgi:phospholipase/carboxylesterase
MKRATLASLDVVLTGGTDGDGGGSGPVVVLLHGFGAPGEDLVGLWRQFAAPRGTRYVFPAAPIDLGPANAGGRAWWMIDLEARIRRDRLGKRDVNEIPDGLDDARPLVDALLDEATRVLAPPAGTLVLGGFSQGAMLSLDVALRSSRPLAGLVLMSGTHIAADEWAPRLAGRRDVPVFMSHGREDPILGFAIDEGLKDTLVAAGFQVEWAPFSGGHGIPPQVVDRVGAFLGRVLAPPAG